MCAFCLTSAQINIVHAVVKTSIQYMRQKKKLGIEVVACVASVSLRFRSKNEERESKGTARKMVHVKEFLALVSFLSRPKPVFLCSVTKRKRLLRRLSRLLNSKKDLNTRLPRTNPVSGQGPFARSMVSVNQRLIP